MKKIILLWIVVSTSLFASCRRTYTCQCVTTYNGANPITVETKIKSTKSNATSTCKNSSSSATSSGLTVTTTCSLK